MAEATQTAVLTLPEGEKIELPVIVGSENERAIDIRRLRSNTGYVALDNGFGNTASCQSAITYIDGESGILRYRGYPIEQLAEQSSFVEVSYLLIYGELPSKTQLEEFSNKLTMHTLVHEDMKQFYDGFPRDAHPMAILSSVVAACYSFYQDWEDPKDKERQDLGIVRLMAKLPTMAAYSFKKHMGHPFIYPDNNLSYSGRMLKMMFATPADEYIVDPEIEKILDLLLILHADHEQNCSAASVRLVGSSLSNLYACISSGISALWGSLHGGANQRVIEMLYDIVNSGTDVKEYVEKAKSKDSKVRLMGFGHRVYKNYDPRAKILKAACHRILKKLPTNNPLLEVAQELEAIALEDDYFISKKLYPNVDFYSGIIYSALGIPINGFTVMFALGRLPGWIAQWREMVNDPTNKLGRPRQIYVGENQRDYLPIDKR